MMSFKRNNANDANGSLPADLDWQAFCYLMDELQAEERTSFELGLAEEQSYREALARAVELKCAVVGHYAANEAEQSQRVANAPAPQVTVARSAERWMQAATWFTIASAACLAFVVVYWALNPQATDVARQSDLKISSQTALLWSEVRESSPAAELLSTELAPLPVDSFVLEEEEEYASESPTELPSWLLTAVSGRSETDSDFDQNDPQAQPESSLPEEL